MGRLAVALLASAGPESTGGHTRNARTEKCERREQIVQAPSARRLPSGATSLVDRELKLVCDQLVVWIS